MDDASTPAPDRAVLHAGDTCTVVELHDAGTAGELLGAASRTP